MIKFNEKQKKLLRIYAIIIFCVTLIVVLNYYFVKRNNKDILGTWKIGYKYYNKETKKNEYTFTQELTFLRDNTFTIREVIDSSTGSQSFVTGEYKVKDNKITLVYNKFSKKENDTLLFDGNKICTTLECDHYYTKDKKPVYFNVQLES